jgi:hypothetical protein
MTFELVKLGSIFVVWEEFGLLRSLFGTQQGLKYCSFPTQMRIQTIYTNLIFIFDQSIIRFIDVQ